MKPVSSNGDLRKLPRTGPAEKRLMVEVKRFEEQGNNAPLVQDPVVVYDVQRGRWIISDFAWSNFVSGPYYQCIAVSKTADPLSGGWWLYAFRADDSSHPWLNDYPKLGVWSDGIYMSANMFDIRSSSGLAYYKGVRVRNLCDSGDKWGCISLF
jgi:hypothetical protein